MSWVTRILLAVVVLIVSGITLNFYSYIFAKDVKGSLVRVERLNLDVALMTSRGSDPNPVPAQLYSFAVAIRSDSGEIFTASSEDRQWAVADKGMCVEAKFYPYPPWNLDKSGTYHNARLLRMGDCPLK